MNETVGTGQLEALRERVRAATGQDNALDLEIVYTLGDGSHNLTGSIDAALGLVERVLPDVNNWSVEKVFEGFEASFGKNFCQDGHWVRLSEVLPTAPLAILDALLSALIAQSKAEGRSSPQSDTGE